MTRKIIGLTGNPGVGKDTIANRLVKSHKFVVLAFATQLKVELATAFGVLSTSLFEDRRTKATPHRCLSLSRCKDAAFVGWYLSTSQARYEADTLGQLGVLEAARSPRWLMQRWGTDWRKARCASYWIDLVQDQIDILPPDQPVIMSDVRFADEAALCDYIIEIVRPDNPHCDKHAAHALHISNNPLPREMVDVTVRNSGTVNQLVRKAQKAVDNFFAKTT